MTLFQITNRDSDDYHPTLLEMLKTRYFDGGGLTLNIIGNMYLDLENTHNTSIIAYFEHETDTDRHYMLNHRCTLKSLIQDGNDVLDELDSMGFRVLLCVRWNEAPVLDNSYTVSRELNLSDYTKSINTDPYLDPKELQITHREIIHADKLVDPFLKNLTQYTISMYRGIVLSVRANGKRVQLTITPKLNSIERYEELIEFLKHHELIPSNNLYKVYVHVLDVFYT